MLFELCEPLPYAAGPIFLQQIDAARLVQDRPAIDALRPQTPNSFDSQLAEYGIRLHLSCDSRVSAGRVHSGKKFPLQQ